MCSILRRVLFVLPALALFSVGCQQAGPDPREAKKQVVRELFVAIDAQDFDRVGALLPPDSIGHIVGSEEAVSQPALLQMIPRFYTAFPDYRHVVEEAIVEGDIVATRLTYNATHQAEFQGIAPTGKHITYGGMQFFRVADGVVKEWWLLEDTLSLMSQLGMHLTPETPEAP